MSETMEKNTPAKVSRSVLWLYGLATLGAALGNLSQTGLNAMLPSAMAELGVQVDVGQWLTTGYMLVLGIAVPLATYLIRKLDSRSYLLFSFGLFAVGSLVDCVAPGFFTALLGRILQAVSVGLVVPKMQTIAMMQFPPGRQATAMGVSGIALGFAPNVGPTVGGALDYAFGWRSFFVLLLGVSVVLIALTLAVVKREEPSDVQARFEAPSFVFSTLGFGGVLLGLSQASSFGLASPWVWVPVVVGVAFTVAFVRRQRTVDDPLMDLRIFQSQKYVNGLLASVFLFACYMGVTLVIPLYVQDALGGTSLDAGLVILPTTFTALVVNPLAGVLADKTSPRFAALIFGSFLLAGSVLSVTVGLDTPLWLLSIYQALRGIGVSGLIGPLITFGLSGLKGPLVPHGSATTVIFRQVAATFSTAIMVLLVTMVGEVTGLASALPYQAAFLFSAVMAVLSFGVIVFRVKE